MDSSPLIHERGSTEKRSTDVADCTCVCWLENDCITETSHGAEPRPVYR